MKRRHSLVLSAAACALAVVLIVVLWLRRCDNSLPEFQGSDGYLVLTIPNTEVIDGAFYGPDEREAVGREGSVAERTDPTFGGFGAYGDDLESTCDVDGLATFLGATNTARGERWAAVLDTDIDSLGSHLGALGVAVLDEYVLVTMHSISGNSTVDAAQVVLTPGTAVLADADGNPVVRCLTGSPLTPVPAATE